MPYQVGGKGTSGCAGFPVVDDKGKVHGCHPTKNKAGRQVRALYAAGAAKKQLGSAIDLLNKDMVSEGDFVLAVCEEETHIGIVQYVMKDGVFGVPGSEYAKQASPEAPVVLIRILEWDEEDGWEESPYLIGSMASDVTKIPPLQLEAKEEMQSESDMQMSAMKSDGYKGCGCPTCKELNVDCPNCPVCSQETDNEMDSEKRDYSPKTRERMAEENQAMPDGSFPIANAADLRNAIQSVGRAKDYSAAKQHIVRRARSLGMTDMLPEDWKNTARKGMTGWGGSVFDITPFVK